MLCCSRKSKLHSKQEEITYLTKNTHFTSQELAELKTRFNRMAKNTNFITKIQFRDNLGLLGLGTMFYLSDRIFDIMDDDRDGKIRFQDFALYFDKVSFGDANDKAEISFKLIDKNKQGYFTFTEFNNTMQGIISSWITLTGQNITQEVKKQLDSRIKQIFDTMDVNEQDKVTLLQYQISISKDPNLLEIFDFIKKGLQDINTIQQDRDQLYKEKLQTMEKALEELIEYMKKPDHIELAELKQERFSSSYKKQITLDSIQQQFPHFTENDDHQPLPSTQVPSGQQRSLPLDYHSPIESILHFQSIYNQNVDQTSHRVILTHNIQKVEINYPTFQQALSHSGSLIIQSQNISPFRENHNPSSVTFSQQNITKVKVQFKQIPRVEDHDEIPQQDYNLSLISEQQSEEQEQIQMRASKHPLLRLSLQSQQEEMDQFLSKLTDKQIQQKYKSVLQAAKLLSEEIKYLKHMMEDDKFMREKQEFRSANLDSLRANTAAKVHKHIKEQREKKVHKKPKISVSFGHENFNLVLNMMMGIQMAVNSINMSDDYEISSDDYKLKYYFELLPKRDQTDKATVKVCQFFDYAPRVFNSIRIIHKIDNQAYLKSIGPETLLQSLLKGDLSTLQELTSTGKSGSFFYYTADGKFTLKTVHHQEFRFLKRILKQYYEHIKGNQDSLIIKYGIFINRFFGMHKIGVKYSTLKKEKVIYFVIMSNIFSTSKEINQRYDLKGSQYKRITIEEYQFINFRDPTIAMKDLNFINNKVIFKLEPAKKNAFITQLEKDCAFFAQNNIIDYSLLVGIHKKNKIDNESSAFSEQNYYDTIQVLHSTDKQEIYYFGIIDILTDFSTKKKLEYLSKRVVYGPSISAIPPNDYSQRFYHFIYQSIMKTQSE